MLFLRPNPEHLIEAYCFSYAFALPVTCQLLRAPYSACFVMFSSTPTHIKVTNSDDPP